MWADPSMFMLVCMCAVVNYHVIRMSTSVNFNYRPCLHNIDLIKSYLNIHKLLSLKLITEVAMKCAIFCGMTAANMASHSRK
jgi:hypothetical protein